jgi:hypothetical protein
MIRPMHNIAARAVIPVKFNKKTDAPKSTKSKQSWEFSVNVFRFRCCKKSP